MGFQETFNERVIPAANRAFGITAVLKHGAGQTEEFTAVWEKVTYQVIDNEGYPTSFASRDFMFPITVATIGGQTFEPRAGDRIAFTENSVAVEFELLPVGNMPAAELMPGGYRWKVHTTKVA